MLNDHGWNNTEKSRQNTRRTGPSVTFWTTNLTWSDQGSSPDRSATTYDLTPGTECDSTLLSNVPRPRQMFSQLVHLLRVFWRENGHEVWRQGRDTDRGDRSTRWKTCSSATLSITGQDLNSGCRVGQQRPILSHITVFGGSESSKFFKLMFYRTHNIVLPSV